MNKVLGLLVAAVLVGGVALAPRVSLGYECLQECYDECDAEVPICEDALDSLDLNYTTDLAACADTTFCYATCDFLSLDTDCSTATATTTTTTATTSSAADNFAGWRTIVPKDCQTKKGGCDICEVSKIFTNAADLIAGAVSAVALLMFILGGLFWIFSGGVESRVETGKKILVGTVSGLALVFVAWFGVNVIVRTASLSGDNSSPTDGKTTSTIFTSEWWEFKGCYPDLPTTCKGLNIGAACGFGACSGGTYRDPNCACYRASDTTGDTSTCDGDPDITDISVAGDISKNKSKQCMCTDTCTLFAATTAGASYVCTATATVDAAPTRYDKNTTLTCAVANTVCAREKH